MSKARILPILLQNTLPMIFQLLFGVFVVDASLVILVMYGFAGDFYDISKHLVPRLKKEMGNVQGLKGKERKYCNTFLMSCQIERIKIGMSNYIKTTTPPAFQLFSLRKIVDLLLVR